MASGLTPIFLLPYPLATDPVDVHGDVYDLADRLDDVLNTFVRTNVSNTFTEPQIISVNSATTAFRITQVGAGDALRVEDESNPDSTPFIIDSSGNVGIGIATPDEKLEVVGNIKTTGSFIFEGTQDANELTLTTANPAADYTVTIPSKTGTIAFTNDKLSVFAATTSAELATVISDETGSGLLVFATSPTLTTPTINTINISSSSTAAALWNTTLTTGSISMANSLTTGSVNIGNGTVIAAGTINIASGASAGSKNINIGASSTAGTTAIIIGSSSGATSTVGINGLTTITPHSSSTNALIVKGVSAQSANLQEWRDSSNNVLASMSQAGNFAAVTKSFDIEHPTKENMRLRYASLEGPENGVYVRGKSKNKIISLPDYWTGLVSDDSITVQLTAIGSGTIYVDFVANNAVKVGGTAEEFYYFIQAERKDTDKLIVEY